MKEKNRSLAQNPNIESASNSSGVNNILAKHNPSQEWLTGCDTTNDVQYIAAQPFTADWRNRVRGEIRNISNFVCFKSVGQECLESEACVQC